MRRTRLGAVAAVAGLFLLIAWTPADAQAPKAPALRTGTVEVRQATGPVDVQRKGQGAWTRIAAGARLSENDQIRALAGGWADLLYPDGSTVLLAENSRLVMTRLAYDPATRARNIGSHLAVGKIKAEVRRAAVQLVRARQSNFLISTPRGVAAVRGTVVFIAFNPATNQVFVAATPSPGQPAIEAVVQFVAPGPPGAPPVTVTISGGQFTTKVGDAPPSPPQSLATLPPAVVAGLGTPANPTTTGDPNLTAIVRIVTQEEMEQIVEAAPPPPVTAEAPPPSEAPPEGAPAPSGQEVSPTG